MRNELNVITKCTLLGVEILNNFSADIDHSVKQLNCKYTVLLKLQNYFIISTVRYTAAYRLMITCCVRFMMV